MAFDSAMPGAGRPLRTLLRWIGGILVRPAATLDEIARARSVGWALVLAALGVLQVWLNMLLFAAFGFDWLGTVPLLSDPTYVGGFGYLRVEVGAWLPIFAALLPFLGLMQLTLLAGVAQLGASLVGGRGRFEQMVNALAFAFVPSLLIGWLSEWLTGVPLNLIAGHPYAFVALMEGEFGSTLAAIWNVYAVAVYTGPWLWGVALGTLAIRRIQRLSWGASALTMGLGFALWMLVVTTFVR